MLSPPEMENLVAPTALCRTWALNSNTGDKLMPQIHLWSGILVAIMAVRPFCPTYMHMYLKVFGRLESMIKHAALQHSALAI